MVDPWRELKRRGYKVVYVPHEAIEDHISCYRVEYEGRVIHPPAADKLGIPLNEIWISETFKPYAKYILYHELREIDWRARGYGAPEAHRLAERDEEEFWRGDPGWERLKQEINIAPLKALTEVRGIGKTLAHRICEHRPYGGMDDLRRVPYIGKARLERLRERFWCICEESPFSS
ncbi:ComEA family DNA-binding protein [Candidatus Bipolaricaulota sp. J31]